jgi:hypothetical protein
MATLLFIPALLSLTSSAQGDVTLSQWERRRAQLTSWTDLNNKAKVEIFSLSLRHIESLDACMEH